MNRPRLSRPSLKITRQAEENRPTYFIVEVWNPFVSAYQPANSVKDGLVRVGELANLISRMWVQRHSKREVLVDVPDAPAADGQPWAEFRINASTFKSYDTRYDDRPAWARSAGMTQAATTTCARVGYALPPFNAS
jgi:hypothetical protein